MGLLPEDPRQQQYVLVIILAVALVALGLFAAFSPYQKKRAEMAEIEERLAELEGLNQIAESRMGNLDGLRRRLSDSERAFGMLERLVPSGAEVPAIYEAIATQTQALGLRLISVVPADPVADTGSYFLRQNWDMRVQGDYHSVGTLLTRVASFDRIVRPQVRDIRPAELTASGRQLVEVNLGLETFVLPPEHAMPGSVGSASDDG